MNNDYAYRANKGTLTEQVTQNLSSVKL